MFFDFQPLKPFLHRLDLLAWDCDGTLVDNEARALDVICEEIGKYVRKYAMENGLPFEETAVDCCRPYAGRPLHIIREVYSDYLGILIPEDVDKAIKKRRMESPEPNEDVKAISVFADLAKFLKSNKVYQRVATGSEPDRAIRYIKAAGLGPIFSDCKDWLFSGHKPSPEAHCAARHSLLQTPFNKIADPARTIGIEDSVSGVKAGVADGLVVIGHALPSHISCNYRNNHKEKLLAAGAVAVICKPEDAVSTLLNVLKILPERTTIVHHPTKVVLDEPLRS